MANKFHEASWYNNTDANPTADEAIAAERANARAVLDLQGAKAPQNVEILDGAITPIGGFVIVDTEGQSAADDLATINPLRSVDDTAHDGYVVLLRAADAGRIVTVVNSANIMLAGGANLTLGVDWWLELQFAGGVWHEVSRVNIAPIQEMFSTTAAIGKTPVAIDDGSGNPIFDNSVKTSLGASTTPTPNGIPQMNSSGVFTSTMRTAMQSDEVNYAIEHAQIGDNYVALEAVTADGSNDVNKVLTAGVCSVPALSINSPYPDANGILSTWRFGDTILRQLFVTTARLFFRSISVSGGIATGTWRLVLSDALVKDYVTAQWASQDKSSGYTKWASGKIEQWGYNVADNQPTTVSLPTAMSTSLYSIHITNIAPDDPNGTSIATSIASRTKTSFTVGSSFYFDWYAVGY